MAVVWLNGTLVDAAEAHIPVLDRGVLWGYGLFETMRVYDRKVWALEEHVERLLAGGALLDLATPNIDVIATALNDVIQANGVDDAGCRVTITAGEGPPDPHAEVTGRPNVLVAVWPLRDFTELYEQGAALVTIPGGGRPLAGVKTTSYAVSVAGRVIAARGGADDALFIAEGGRVLEATGSNLFAVVGRRLETPPLEDAILPGVTRRHVIGVARRCGLERVETPLTLSDLHAADEVLLTSSLREVYPVRSVDGREVGRGPVADRLRAAYRAYVLEQLG